jgi:hypothetical protein
MQTTRAAANDALRRHRCPQRLQAILSDDGSGEKDSFLIFWIELGRGLSRVVAAAVVDAMEETAN